MDIKVTLIPIIHALEELDDVTEPVEYDVHIQSDDKVLTLKHILSDKINIDAKLIRLLYNGYVLEDSNYVNMYNINSGDTVAMVTTEYDDESDDVPELIDISYTMELTEDELNDINDLVSLGFSYDEVVQVYMIVGKNKAVAANMLLEQS